MDRVLFFIKKFIPPKIFSFFQPAYHFGLGFLVSWRYGFPSNKLLVVGVTGTTGKTTAVYLIAKMLQNGGFKVGWTSTALLSDGEKEWLNDKKMTMLGRFFTQKMLREMVKNGCEVAIVETTSEGIKQFRHRFINYDVAVFTGIYPEHIESHGNFENYKNEKLKLFKHLERSKRKKFFGRKKELKKIFSGKKTIVANGDDKYAEEFLNFSVEEKIKFVKNDRRENKIETVRSKTANTAKSREENLKIVKYEFLETNETGIKFLFENCPIQLKIWGDFNATNATIAGCIGRVLGFSNEKIADCLGNIDGVPGRLEKIDVGQNFTVIVDYAFEPKALKKMYEIILPIKHRKIIHILGSAGGGRDVSRRQPLGKIAGENADIVIVSNEDPYDDDPMEIIHNVAEGAKSAGKIIGQNLFLIEDRKEAIRKALDLAKENDLVLITGKGCEQAICLENGKKQKWDDRVVTRELLEKRKQKTNLKNG